MAKKRNSKPSPPRTLGPVQDLERHLPPDWWRTLFNAVYLKTDGDVVEDNENTMQDVDLLIEATGIDEQCRILDLCCGQGRHCLELARRGFKNVMGVDRSRYLIRLARRRAVERGLPVTFQEGDARRFRIGPDPFDCVAIMGNSFGYFELERDDRAVVERVRKALVPGGVLALDLVDGEWLIEHFEPRSWEWVDQDHFVCRERSLSRDRQRVVCRELVAHAERGVIADQFYAERLFSREAITRMLTDAGFELVRHHGSVESLSRRNQDLGMMGRRIFMTARAPRPSLAVGRGRKPVPVTVVMGDPTLHDSVKLGGKFNEEDLQTVQRLKESLGSLRRFTFQYLDNHSVLADRLRSDQPALVFNLCDEGFGNDAFRELHVPALLEMLGIPYTGAGPACLAACYDKAMVRSVAQALEIPVPLETYFSPDDQAATIPSVFPALLKPNFGDSSVGIRVDAVVRNPDELLSYLKRLRTDFPGRPVLVQEFLEGPEYSVGLIGNPGINMHVQPVLEVDFSGLDPELPRLLPYEAKWDPKSPYWTQVNYKTADIPDDLRRTLLDHSLTLFERMNCRDYARFDYRCGDDGLPRLLEVNPNPGWCWDGKLNLMAEFEGLSYADLLQMILDAALDRLSLPATSSASPGAERNRSAAGNGQVSAAPAQPAVAAAVAASGARSAPT